MKEYIEAIEQGENATEFFREEVKVTEKIEDGKKVKIFTELEEEKASNLIESKLNDKKTYLIRKHLCYHEEGLPCVTEEL
jgi:hypothetical protein